MMRDEGVRGIEDVDDKLARHSLSRQPELWPRQNDAKTHLSSRGTTRLEIILVCQKADAILLMVSRTGYCTIGLHIL